jgi:DNA gyrase subunit A
VLATANGQGIRFKEGEVRAMGRHAAGVIGIRLKKEDCVVGMEIIADGADILFATERGYGKRVKIEDFRIAHRGGVGVRTIPTTSRNGKVVGLVVVTEYSNILLIDQVGKIIRLSPKEVRTMGRQANGVRLIRLDEGQTLSAVVAFEEQEEGSSGGESLLPETGSMTLAGRPVDAQDMLFLQEDESFDEFDLDEDDVEGDQLEDDVDDSVMFD